MPSLHHDDDALFRRATGVPLPHLVSQIRNLGKESLRELLVFDTGKKLLRHRLNAQGLAVWRYLLARRVVDRRRQRHWGTHSRYEEWVQHGLLTTRLKRWSPGTTNFSLTRDELLLLGLVSGSDSPLSTRHLAEERAWVRPAAAFTFRDDDPQYLMHIDQMMPTWKVFIFLADVTVDRGPFFYVRGSHAATESKLRWIFERTNTSKREIPGSPRHVRQAEQWCSETTSCLRRAFDAQQEDLHVSHNFGHPEPLSVRAGTMVIADTSGLHFRGLGRHSEHRPQMGSLQTLDKPDSRLTIFQLPRRPPLAP